MKDISLKKLITHSADDNNAYRELYERYKDKIFLFVLGIVKNYQASEDITQEIFIRVKKYCNSYDSTKNPKTWLYTIAKNTSYTYIKNYNNEEATETGELNKIFDKYNMIESEDRIVVQEYLSNLSESERTIVILHIFSGLKHYEIAKILNLTHMQVRSKYSYALKKLKKKVGEFYV